MILVRTESFVRDFLALPSKIQKQVEEALRWLVVNPRHPSLHVKKMQPRSRGIFEVRVTKGYRMTFHLDGTNIVIRRVGTHDILRTP